MLSSPSSAITNWLSIFWNFSDFSFSTGKKGLFAIFPQKMNSGERMSYFLFENIFPIIYILCNKYLWSPYFKKNQCHENSCIKYLYVLLKKNTSHMAKPTKTRNAARCNNRDDLLHLSSFSKFQYFWRAIYNPVKHLWWRFHCENRKPLNIFTKKLNRRYPLGF